MMAADAPPATAGRDEAGRKGIVELAKVRLRPIETLSAVLLSPGTVETVAEIVRVPGNRPLVSHVRVKFCC